VANPEVVRAEGDPTSDDVAINEAYDGLGRLRHAGYRGPCPPPGHGRHRYFLRLYALDSDLDLRPGAGKRELERALEGHTLAAAEPIGAYER